MILYFLDFKHDASSCLWNVGRKTELEHSFPIWQRQEVRRDGQEKKEKPPFSWSASAAVFQKKKKKKKLREKKNAQFQNQFEIKIEKRNFEIVRKCLATSSNNNIHVILKTHSSVKL